MVKRLLTVVCLSILLTGCGNSATSLSSETSPRPTDTYATTVQKNNRTVRVKSDAELFADMTLEAPTDEYIRYGYFYECYSLPEEIDRYEYMRNDYYEWEVCDNPLLADIFFHYSPGQDVRFRHYVLEDYLMDKTGVTFVSLNKAGPYENMWNILYSVDNVFYKGLLTQTVEDLEKGENVYSLYIGIESLPPE